MVERFAPRARGLHIDAQVLFDLALPDVLLDASRAERQIELTIFVVGETLFHSR
jgi:hypothetical protein